MKHLPFQSNYRPNFEVVEERRGHLSLYPHTDQLANLLRAVNLELVGHLPGRIARPDPRATPFDKIVRRSAITFFCSYTNAARGDDLHLHPLYDYQFYTRVTVVQMITEHHSRGNCHRFRFYGGEDFFPEIRLSGKRVAFSDHALQRFSKRVPNNTGEDLTFFLLGFFGAPLIALTVGPGRAFLVDYLGSLLAFPFKESHGEFFVTTCLTIAEINSLELEPLPEGVNAHYGETFTEPRVRNWSPTVEMIKHHRNWQRKVPIPPARPHRKGLTLDGFVQFVRGIVRDRGHGPGSRLEFLDRIPGPNALEIAPGKGEAQVDELAAIKQFKPDIDWDRYVAERREERERRIREGV